MTNVRYKPLIGRSLIAKLSQGPAVLTLCLLAGQSIGLIRTTLTARLLGTEIQGEAVVIGLITGFFASMFTLNAAWQIVQSPKQNSPQLAASLHASSLLRGVGATALIAMASMLLLDLIDRPNLMLPMLLASTVPAIEGLTNLDAWRLIRERRYRRLGAVELSGSMTSTLTAIVALAITRSIWVVPIVAVSNSLGRAATSHLVATRSWRPWLHRENVREIIRFSLPLIPAGILFWINTQSDRIVILLSEQVTWMQRFDTRALGAYGTVAMLVLLPRGTIVKTMDSIVIPKISAARADPERLRQAFRESWLGVLLLAAAFVLGGSIFGPLVFRLVLGPEFQSGADVAGLLICAMAIQLFRSVCYSSSTGMGTTVTVLVGNLARLSGLVLALIAASLHLGLVGLAWSVVIAEAIAAIAAGAWLGRLVPSAFGRVVVAVAALGLSTLLIDAVT